MGFDIEERRGDRNSEIIEYKERERGIIPFVNKDYKDIEFYREIKEGIRVKK